MKILFHRRRITGILGAKVVKINELNKEKYNFCMITLLMSTLFINFARVIWQLKRKWLMNNNIATNTLIRNFIIAFDFILLWVMLTLYIKYGNMPVRIPSMFVVLGTVAMAFAEFIVSPIVHTHYLSVDKVMQRTVKFMFTFSILFFLFCSIHRWTDEEIIPGKGVGIFAIWMSIALVIVRFVEFFAVRIGRAKGRNSRSLAFVGDAEGIEGILNEIDCNAVKGLRLVGYYSDEESERLSRRMSYMGSCEQMKAVMEQGDRIADDIYCTLPSSENEFISLLMRNCLEQVSRFYYLPSFMQDFGSMLQPQIIGSQVLFTNYSEPLLDPLNRLIKRTFDVCASAIILLFLLPFVPIIAAIIKSQSPGPVFFKQKRTGLDGKDFFMYKFRSMHVNSDADRLQATKDDPRKFAFGNFMRKTNIDELPQFFNVLCGDMSLVGPRPHMLAHTEEYRGKIEEYMLRHYVRPGITGWAQTTGFRGETAELWQMEGRVKRDIWYIQNWSFWLDIRIILKTIWNMLLKEEKAY